MQTQGKIQLITGISIIIAGLLSGCDSDERNTIAPVKADSISVSTELEKLYDISNLPTYENTARSYQISSYDTTGGNDDGFGGRYSFLRRNSDSTLVIFEVSGPGVIHRFWTPTPTNDTLDFYIDNPDQVEFSRTYRIRNVFGWVGLPFLLLGVLGLVGWPSSIIRNWQEHTS